jgi:hypothetical protein
MSLIRELENKFQKIEAKLDSYENHELIGGNDTETIKQLFELKEDKYKNGLKECRDEMLKELIAKRDEELNQVNRHPKDNRAQLKALDKSIKSKHFVFAKGLASIYESILFRSKFTCSFKFAQLAKYAKFMKNKKTFSLPIVDHIGFDQSNTLIDSVPSPIHFHVLSSDLIFIFIYVYHDSYANQINMGVINHFGEVIHSKSITREQDRKYSMRYEFKVNATNIIALNEIDSIVEIYDFKLELIHSIKLDRSCELLRLNNYEIAFDNNHDREYDDDSMYTFLDSDDEYELDTSIDEDFKTIITCYNYQTIHTKKTEIEICLDENCFRRVIEEFFELVGVNDRFFFLAGRRRKHSHHLTIICLLNREDQNNFYKSFKCDFESCLIYNAEVCGQFYDYDAEDMFYVYDIDNNDSDDPSAIVKCNFGEIVDVIGFGNKYIYSRDIDTFTYNQD